SDHRRLGVPPPLSHPFPRVPLPISRRPRPPRCLAGLAAPPACAFPPLCPSRLLRRRPDSAHRASAAATGTGIRRLACVLRASTPVRAGVFRLRDVPCTSRGPPSPIPTRDLSSS